MTNVPQAGAAPVTPPVVTIEIELTGPNSGGWSGQETIQLSRVPNVGEHLALDTDGVQWYRVEGVVHMDRDITPGPDARVYAVEVDASLVEAGWLSESR